MSRCIVVPSRARRRTHSPVGRPAAMRMPGDSKCPDTGGRLLRRSPRRAATLQRHGLGRRPLSDRPTSARATTAGRQSIVGAGWRRSARFRRVGLYDGYRAAPRQAPETSQPPASRSSGGVIEHRGAPPAAAPAREPGPPPSAGPPRGEARPRGEAPSRADAPSRGDSPSRGDAGRSRPSGGQGQSDRGGAVRRGGGRG